MLRHIAFYEVLGSLAENSEDSKQMTAGLVVLRMLDNACLDGRSGVRLAALSLRPVREAVEALRESDPARAILMKIVEHVGASTASLETGAVCELLLEYGKSLQRDGRFTLAMDVFENAARLAPDPESSVAIDAHIMNGWASRLAGKKDASLEAYGRAVNSAARSGDLARALQAEVGIANTYLTTGDLGAAEEVLDAVIKEAREENFANVVGLALHSRATVAHLRRDFPLAVELAFAALQQATDTDSRDLLLTDIAAGFAELGLRDAARDALLIASVTSQSPVVQASTTINLLELAGLDGMEEAFDSYAASLATKRLDARNHAYYLLYLGQGQSRLGRGAAAAESLERAKVFAAENKIEQIWFEAESELTKLTKFRAAGSRPEIAKQPSAEIPESTLRIAGELTEMRELALANS
jgi:hypothetical protein